MKRISAVLLWILILLCTLNVTGENVNAESVRLPYKSIVVIKGQDVCIPLKGADSSDKITWNISGRNIEIYKTDRYGGEDACCYINAIHTGTGTLTCVVNIEFNIIIIGI